MQRSNRAPSPREHAPRLVEANHVQGIISNLRIIVKKGHEFAIIGHSRCHRRTCTVFVQHGPDGIFEAMFSPDGSHHGKRVPVRAPIRTADILQHFTWRASAERHTGQRTLIVVAQHNRHFARMRDG